jgi:hypothetical protein
MKNYKLECRRVLAEHPAWSNHSIAAYLGTSERTVRRHIGGIKERRSEREDSFEEICRKNTAISSIPLEDNAKILVVDIESSLCEGYFWHTGKQYVGPDQIIKGSSILCWSALWFGYNKIYSSVVAPQESIDRTDRSVLKRLWDLLDKADVVVGHNVKRFDIPKINARFLLNGYPKPSPYQIWDTLAESRKHFGVGMESHKLDYLSFKLSDERKIETGYQLWKDCAMGSQDALTKMRVYCNYDVELTAQLLLDLQPWMTGKNIATFLDTEEMVCPICGHTELTEVKPHHTIMGVYKAYRCKKCKALGRAKTSQLSQEKSKNQLRAV